MSDERETLKKSLSELPLPLIAAVMMRAILRYLSAFLESKVAPKDRPPLEETPREKYGTPFTRFVDWLDKGARGRDEADERRLYEKNVALRGFRACQTTLVSISFAFSCTDKALLEADGKHHAATATFALTQLSVLCDRSEFGMASAAAHA